MTTLARILTGESATMAGRQAVLNVIMNRAKVNFSGFGSTWIQQATAPKQFSCYPDALGPEDGTTESMIQAAIAGELGNIVPLSLNYANPNIMKFSEVPESWVWKAQASGQGVEIGGNTFWANSQGGSPGYDSSKLWKGTTMTDPTSPAPSQLQTVAGQIAGDIDTFQKVEPEIAAFAQFIPGASPIIAMLQPFEPTIMSFASRALHDIANANGGDLGAAFIEFVQHLTPGQPNSPTLTTKS